MTELDSMKMALGWHRVSKFNSDNVCVDFVCVHFLLSTCCELTDLI